MTFQMPILFPRSTYIRSAVTQLSEASGAERGAVFTKGEVVDFILDLVGYEPCRALYQERLLEPSFGGGDFLRPAVQRLLISYFAAGFPAEDAAERLAPAIRAVELHRDTFNQTRQLLRDDLVDHGLDGRVADALLGVWLVCDDFLLTSLEGDFTKVVGNPPYLRQEMIPAALLAEYRRCYKTLYDRADLYIPFIERSLGLLAPGGDLSFICADRWLKNRYGGPLRHLVAAGGYHLKAFVDMSSTQAFHAEVIAYPGIFVIERSAGNCTAVARSPQIERAELRSLATAMRLAEPDPRLTLLDGIVVGDAPWVLDATDSVMLLRRLEATLPTLEEAGCKVSIGVATGADRIFIGDYEALPVEPERKLPLAMASDIASGEVRWGGRGVINPFGTDGKVVPLDAYPHFASYIMANAATIQGRNVAKKNTTNWYRTIDRIHAELTARPKLLIPDIKDRPNVVFEDGHLYPHHNLYYVLSDEWDLRALQAVLLSEMCSFFVASYSTKMRGGFLRFQAQYLRRIRVPHWRDVPPDLRVALANAATCGNLEACNELSACLFGISSADRQAIRALLLKDPT